jgi:protein O-GlcNAc transferase
MPALPPSHSTGDPTAALSAAVDLHRRGKLRDAMFGYKALIDADPRNAAALHLFGVGLLQMGDAHNAVQRIRAAIDVDPVPAEPWANLGLALEACARPEAAANALKEAAKRAPRDPAVWANLSGIELNLGRRDEAEASARQALAIDDRHAPAWYQLALALEPAGRVLEALDAASRAAGIAPEEPTYSGFKAQVETALDRHAAAKATLDAALARRPTSTRLKFQRAGVHESLGEFGAAIRDYQDVVQLDPDDGAALSQLVFLKRRLADWRGLPALEAAFAARVASGKPPVSPFALLSGPSTRPQQRRCAEDWSARLPAPEVPPPPLPPADPARPLRIGYLSADFHEHATAALAAGVFEAHDRSRVAIAAYSTGPDDGSPTRARLVRAFDRFVDARHWTVGRLAAQIRADRIDVLVDLKGHTAGAPTAVLALRPAPVQAQWLGFPGTMGAPWIEWLIGDAVVAPEAHAADYSETLVRLPGSYQPNDRQRPVNDPPPRAALGLPEGAFVFACFNQTYKLNAAVLDAWARILQAVPGSVLWLLARGPSDPAIANLRREAQARGVAPERLVFAEPKPNPDYLGQYRHVDLVLDTWPYGAHTTASDALWAGAPVLTWPGETFASRVAASLLTAVGLPELVARNAADYEAEAIALAADPERRARLRAQLAGPGRDSALFDPVRFARGLEAAYAAMVAQARAGTRAAIDLAASGGSPGASG